MKREEDKNVVEECLYIELVIDIRSKSTKAILISKAKPNSGQAGDIWNNIYLNVLLEDFLDSLYNTIKWEEFFHNMEHFLQNNDEEYWIGFLLYAFKIFILRKITFKYFTCVVL